MLKEECKNGEDRYKQFKKVQKRMAQVCLDSEVAIDFLRGDNAVVEKLRYYADSEELCISPFLLLQLNLGVRKREVVSGFISNVSTLSFDKKAANIAVRLIQDSHENGFSRDIEGVLTAAVCIAHDAFLFTKDRKKYEGIKGLKLV